MRRVIVWRGWLLGRGGWFEATPPVFFLTGTGTGIRVFGYGVLHLGRCLFGWSRLRRASVDIADIFTFSYHIERYTCA